MASGTWALQAACSLSRVGCALMRLPRVRRASAAQEEPFVEVPFGTEAPTSRNASLTAGDNACHLRRIAYDGLRLVPEAESPPYKRAPGLLWGSSLAWDIIGLHRPSTRSRLCRQPSVHCHREFTPDLARSLNNLSLRLADLQRHQEALRRRPGGGHPARARPAPCLRRRLTPPRSQGVITYAAADVPFPF